MILTTHDQGEGVRHTCMPFLIKEKLFVDKKKWLLSYPKLLIKEKTYMALVRPKLKYCGPSGMQTRPNTIGRWTTSKE